MARNRTMGGGVARRSLIAAGLLATAPLPVLAAARRRSADDRASALFAAFEAAEREWNAAEEHYTAVSEAVTDGIPEDARKLTADEVAHWREVEHERMREHGWRAAEDRIGTATRARRRARVALFRAAFADPVNAARQVAAIEAARLVVEPGAWAVEADDVVEFEAAIVGLSGSLLALANRGAGS